MATASQRGRDRDQVVVVNPDKVVFDDDLFQLVGEVLIHPEIAAEIPARELGKIQPVMQYRPQHAIGETIVVFLIIFVRQIGDDVFDVLVLDGPRLQRLWRVRRRDLAAPAEPDATIALQRGPQRHFQTSGALRPFTGRN